MHAQTTATVGSLTYSLGGDTAIVSSHGSTLSENLEIRNSITYGSKNYTVMAVAENAFNNTGVIKMVTFPSTLKIIGASAFYGTAIASVTFTSTNAMTGVFRVAGSSNLAKMAIVSGNMATSIQTVAQNNSNGNATACNLAGQRVGASYKGIVIRNGRKAILQ